MQQRSVAVEKHNRRSGAEIDARGADAILPASRAFFFLPLHRASASQTVDVALEADCTKLITVTLLLPREYGLGEVVLRLTRACYEGL